MDKDIDSYIIQGKFSKIYYIPEFITPEEENILLKEVASAPKPKWTQLSNRRLQNWGGVPHPKGMIAEELPSWLKKYTDKIGSLNVFGTKEPNHVLVNEYESGQGIMPHLDGSLFYPTITTISLGSHTVLNFYEPLKSENSSNTEGTIDTITKSFEDRLAFSLFVQPRSLLILQEDCYHHYLHGIDEKSTDLVTNTILNTLEAKVVLGNEYERTTRVSLTIRHVPKTVKSIFKLGK